MQPFNTLESVAAALPIENLDTDVIIRIERLTALEKNQLGPYALEALRFHSDGSENVDFILNQSAFRQAQVLVGGSNFGCGSSREAAVWALLDQGIRCVIAPSFGDIFYSNCIQNGLLPAKVSMAQIVRLMELALATKIFRVDLHGQQIKVACETFQFEIDERRKNALLLGLDPLQVTLQAQSRIREWQASDRLQRPWAWLSHKTPDSPTTH